MTLKIVEKHMVNRLVWLSWFMYFTAYFGRLSYTACMPAMISSGFLQKPQAGMIGTVFFISYGLGQFINGFAGDHFSPGNIIFTGLLISSLSNLMMGFGLSYGAAITLWAVNGFCQSMLWPPLVRIFSNMLVKEDMVKGSVNISSATALGSLGSYLICAAFLALSGWQSAFWANAFIMLIMAIVWKVVFSKIEVYHKTYGTQIDSPEEGVSEEESSQQNDSSGQNSQPGDLQASFFQILLSPVILMILIPVFVHGILKDGVSTWVPTFILEVFEVSPTVSVLLSTILPLFSISGVYIANYLNKHYIKSELLTASLLFIVSCAALLLLDLFGTANLAICLILLAVVSCCMLGVNTMLVTIVPLYYGIYGRAATMSGFLNSVAYLGTAFSTAYIGYMVQNHGWNSAIMSWLVVGLIALLFTFGGRKFPFKIHPIHEDK